MADTFGKVVSFRPAEQERTEQLRMVKVARIGLGIIFVESKLRRWTRTSQCYYGSLGFN